MSIDWIPLNAARDIPAKERGNRGFFPSFKVSGGIAKYESCLERDIFLVFHHAPDVTKFQHQPITISYQDKSGKTRKYTPDVYVEFKEGQKGLYEIKYEEERVKKSEKYQERWTAAKKWAEKRNIHFSILTEKDIRTSRWFNIWFTLGSSKCRSVDKIIPKLKKLIPEKGKRYEELCHLFAEDQGIEINKSAQIMFYAIYHGLVFVDTFSTKPLSNATFIRKSKKTVFPFRSLWEELNNDSDKRREN